MCNYNSKDYLNIGRVCEAVHNFKSDILGK